MSEVEVRGKKYHIRALDPWFKLRFAHVSSLMERIPLSTQDADRIIQGIKVSMLSVVERAVEPRPDPNDPDLIGELFSKVAEVFNEESQRLRNTAEFFRGDRGVSEGGSTRNDAPPKAQHAPGDGGVDES